ncbi:hypothetical protein V6N12_003812 [Hibiscus sabdariffa]|uniref:Uncharacterized protein n=1 Tax=Hibiscus sabdariffa TaxID=183260 RepID=A0ABR2CJL6_9ROSI
MLQYSNVPSEPALVIETNRPGRSWPFHGEVNILNLQVRYAPHMPLVLRGDPVMFEGTIRSNLDPLEEYTDQQIWEALDKCQLGDQVRRNEHKLDSTVSENGDNWSIGQRQLIYNLIQTTLREQFSGCTVITIAHRITSVLDSDMVLLLDHGLVEEYDSPAKLLENKWSSFSQLVADAVDAHTGSHLFKEVLLGILSFKTVIYVTHQVEFLHAADLILVMKNGRITQAGKYNDILDSGVDFMELVGAHNKALSAINTIEAGSASEKCVSEADGAGGSVNREMQKEVEESYTELLQIKVSWI